jgi:RHS repeat-associated protein
VSHLVPQASSGQTTLVPDTWPVVRTFDRQGNCVVYDHSLFSGAAGGEEWVLSSIRYTGTASGDIVGGTATCAVGTDARRVDFAYSGTREDRRTTYRTGQASPLTARLDAILTSAGGQPVRRYELAYRTSAATGRSLLASVRLCAGATCGPAQLPATIFNYQEDVATFSPTTLANPTDGTRLGHDWRIWLGGDYDGDGNRDWIYLHNTSTGVSRTLGLSSCPSASPTSLDGTPFFAGFDAPLDATPWVEDADATNDGRADLVGTSGGYLAFGSLVCGDPPTWTLVTSNQQPFTPGSNTPQARLYVDAVDWDGDGLVDIKVRDPNGTGPSKVYRRLGAGMPPQFSAGISLYNAPGIAVQMDRDFDGDGKMDTFLDGAVGGNPFTAIAFGWSVLPTALSDLGGPPGGFNALHHEHRRWLDVNGDGLPDIFEPGAGPSQPGTVWINQGGTPRAGMFRAVAVSNQTVPDPATTIYDPKRVKLAFTMDIDGDGQDEYLVPTVRVIGYCGGVPETYLPDGSERFWCGDGFDESTAEDAFDHSVFAWDAYKLRQTGAGGFELVRIPTNLTAPVREKALQAADYDGDGLNDVYYRLITTVLNTRSGTRYAGYLPDPSTFPEGPYLSRNMARAPDLLTSATDGLGATAAWTHQPLSRAEAPAGCDPDAVAKPFYVAHHDDPHSPGYVFFTSSMWAVSKLEVSNGVGAGTNATCYRYEDAMLHSLGRGFQGFKKIVAEERLPPAAGEDSAAAVDGPCGPGNKCSGNNRVTTTEFSQEFPLTDRVKRVAVVRASDGTGGTPISETTHAWYAVATQAPTTSPSVAPGTFVVFPSATVEKRYDLGAAAGATPLATTTTIGEIDAVSGEATRQCTIVDDSAAGGRVTFASEERTLATDPARWWLGRMDFRRQVSDLAAPFTVGALPATCPTPQGAPDAKIRRTTYSWYDQAADTSPAGFRRKLQSEVLHLGASSTVEEARTTYPASTGYDSFGNPRTRQLTARDVAGTLTTAWTTTADGYFIQTETDPEGHVSTTIADPATGQPTWRQAVQGGPATAIQYDVLGRPLTEATDGTQPADHRQLACASLATYGLPACQGEAMARATFRPGSPTSMEYLDVLGRTVRSAAQGFDGTFVVQSEVVLNERGLKVMEYAPRLLGGTPYATRYSKLDALGRVGHKEVDRDPALFPTGQGDATLATDYTHAGFKTTIQVDRAGTGTGALQMSRTYDARGKLVETTQRLSSRDVASRYEYDPAGSVKKIATGTLVNGAWLSPTTATSPPPTVITVSYDDLGRKTQVVDPDRGTWTYAWDGLSRLRFQTDANGTVTRQDYDGIGRVTDRTATATGQSPQGAHWTWDQSRKGVLDRVDSTSDGYIRLYLYDSLMRPYRVTTILPALDALQGGGTRTLVVDHGYDRNTGQLRGTRYPGGETVVFEYTPQGYPLGETEWLPSGGYGKQYRRVKSLSPRGQVTDQVLGNCVEEATHYDDSAGMTVFKTALRATGLSSLPQDILSCPGAAGLVRQVTYAHDQFLNLQQQPKNFAGGQATETFTYDDLQRIQSASRTWVGVSGAPSSETNAYHYDDLGNIVSKDDYSLTYSSTTPRYIYGTAARTTGNAGPHAALSVAKMDGSTATFAYDLNGNMVSGDGRTMAFDLMDRPVQVVQNGTTDFAYGPDGARYRERISGAVSSSYGPKTVYSVDKDYELTVWGSGTVEERSYLGSAVVYRQNGAREVRYQHLDRLGSLDAVTLDDAAGSELLVDAHGYDPWGKPRGREWLASGERLHPGGEPPGTPNPPTAGVTTDRGFTGHEHLDVHYLIHMNGRMYDYRLGRFLSVDPIISNPMNPQSVNPYSYIGNNPLSGTDPTGYACVEVTGSHICRSANDAESAVSAYQTVGTQIQWVNFPTPSGGRSSGADPMGMRVQNTAVTDVKSPRDNALPWDYGGKLSLSERGSEGGGTALNRVMGGLRMVGGGLVAGGSVALGAATGWTGGGLVLGGLGFLTGVDEASTGWRQMWSGKSEDTLLSQGLQSAGFSPRSAHLLETTLSLGVGVSMVKMSATAGTAALDEVAAARTAGGVAVLGHYPGYVNTAESIGARHFNVPAEVWARMSPAEQWAANVKFLDRLIMRGDTVVLSTPASAARAGSWFSRELEYLSSRGYTLSADGTRMLPRGP